MGSFGVEFQIDTTVAEKYAQVGEVLPRFTVTDGTWLPAHDGQPFKGMYITEVPCVVDTATQRNLPGVVERRYYVLEDDTVVLQDESRLVTETFPIYDAAALSAHSEKEKVHKVEAQVIFPDGSSRGVASPVLVYTPILRHQADSESTRSEHAS